MRIDDVAENLKVSIATVSRALNPATRHLVAKETRKKIERFVKQTGYVPNRTARELSTGKTKTIGLVLPNILESIFFNDYLIKLLAGVYRVLEEDNQYNCKIVILPKGKFLTRLKNQTLASGLDGLLISPYCDPVLYGEDFPQKLLAGWNRPIVLLNLNLKKNDRFSCVYCDHYETARKAVIYLIEKGHRRIGMIRGSELFPEAMDRFEAYKAVLKDHGIPYRKADVAEGDFPIESGYEAALKLLKKKKDHPSAIFCVNDEMAIGAIRAAKALGLRCPQDVAIMGYDGIDLGNYVEPRLSTIRQPTAEIGETATRLILDLIESKKTGPISISVPAEFLIRESA